MDIEKHTHSFVCRIVGKYPVVFSGAKLHGTWVDGRWIKIMMIPRLTFIKCVVYPRCLETCKHQLHKYKKCSPMIWISQLTMFRLPGLT